MLAALAISTDIWWLQALGYCGWAYLVFLHLRMLWDYNGLGMELLPSYVSVLILKPSISRKHGTTVKLSKYQQFWGFLYKKTTPDQQLMLLMEDGPQALLAGAMAFGGHLSKFTALVNLILPSTRLLLAWLLHDSIARSSMDWLLYEAWRTEAAGQTSICEQRLTGLVQRKGTLRFTAELWRAVLEDLNLETSDRQFDQSYTMLSEAPLSKFLVSLALAETEVWSDLNQCPGRELELSLLHLQHVNLQFAYLGDECIVALATSLAHNVSLEVLELPFNHIGDQGAMGLAKALETNKHLTVLNLGDNDIGAVGATALAKGLTVNNVLEKLYLNENREDWIEEGWNAWDAWAKTLEINTSLTLYLSTLTQTHPGAPDALEILAPFVDQGRVIIIATDEFDQLKLGNLI